MATVEEAGVLSDNLDKKKATVTQKLHKRDEDRLADLSKRREEKDSTAAANESRAFFIRHFNESKSRIEMGIADIEKVEKSELANHFDSLTLELQKMQKFLSDSTMFLPVYEVQKAHKDLAALRTAIEETRQAALPKKKFGFKSKTKVLSEPKPAVKPQEEKKTIQVELIECSFSDIKDQTLTKEDSELNQKDVALTRLEGCTIKLYGSPGAIHINHLQNCKVFTGPVSGSIFIDECTDCVFVIPCQQLRVHSTKNTDFYLHVTSRAIIEDCSNVRFAPYNWSYEKINEHYEISGLDHNRNTWNDVDDFNWLASDAHSPNWSILEENQRVSWN